MQMRRSYIGIAIAALLFAPALAQSYDVYNPQTNASALTTGILAAARGGAGTITGALKGNGSGTVSQAACADLSNATGGCSAAAGQLPATATNDSASAGNVGEYVPSAVPSGSAVSLVTGTGKTVTSISLTAGDWDVSGAVLFSGGATTTVTALLGSISTVNNVPDSGTNERLVQSIFASFSPFTASTPFTIPLPTTRISVSSTTTVYLIGQGAFATSTLSAYGTIRARRAR